MADFDRITQSPDMMGGRPCIRGMRVTVGMIVGQISADVSIDELLADYPYLEREDIKSLSVNSIELGTGTRKK